MVWFWIVCPQCGRKKQRIEWQLDDEEYELLTDDVKKLCIDCYTKWKYLKGIKRLESLEKITGITRLYIPDFNFTGMSTSNRDTYLEEVRVKLCSMYNTKIGKVFKVDPCLERFGYYFYYK